MPQDLGIRELAERAKKDGAFDLAQGVIQADPPVVLVEALKQQSVERNSIYNDKRGVLAYRKALCEFLAGRGWSLDLEQILGTAGAMGATVAALLTKVKKGGSVLLPEPFFIGHKLMLEALGMNVKYFSVPLSEKPDWEAFGRAMKEVDAAIVVSPANPTGMVLDQSTRNTLADVAVQNNCLLLIDEVYRDFLWDVDSFTDDSTYAGLDLSQTVVVRSFSKTLAIPGWRTGFAVTAPERVERMAATHDSLYIGGSTIAQYALAEALSNGRDELTDYVVQLREVLESNMRLFSQVFSEFGLEPLPVPAGYYLLMKHNRESDMATMEELIKKKLCVTPLQVMYSDSARETGYIRAHFAISPDDAEKVAEILGKSI